MTRFVLFALVVGLALAVGTAQALTLQPQSSSSFAWYTWSTTDLDRDGTPYWDNLSSDESLSVVDKSGNIGFWLTKSGPNASPPYNNGPGSAFPTLVSDDGSGNPVPNAPVSDIYFTTDSPNWTAIRVEVAGLKNYNYFGIYKADEPPSDINDLLTSGGPKHKLLFTGGDSAPTSTTFIVPFGWNGKFGWYLAKETTPNSGLAEWAWFSQSSLNRDPLGGNDAQKQHFAFFEVTPNRAYYIGVEDLPMATQGYWSDKDYNDFVVFAMAIPDASTWMLFLSGVPALALLRRRRA